MKFHLSVNMERFSPTEDMRAVERHALAMVELAEQHGFETVWAAEHHANELIVAPNPFLILSRWAHYTSRIRLGTGVVVAPYWHPIKLAEEAALLDLYSGGRLDFGAGSGAFQYEFDRMRPGLDQKEGYLYLQEIVPVVEALWQGDCAHEGKFWRFPTATSVPKPLQRPTPPIWITARSPLTYDWAVPRGYNIICWPITRPFSELEAYCERFRNALASLPPGRPRPRFAAMRHTAVYARKEDWEEPVDAIALWSGRFANLFSTAGSVKNGFVAPVDLAEIKSRDNFNAQELRDNLMFGTPDEVIAKLKRYEDVGIDTFVYFSSFGRDPASTKRSLELFAREVMPAFARAPAKVSA
jgi:alkanesulfonate monooxygenase SsuD/methylene tetrahydromethanopterin reductase-like flavin-dependent oxidoreductase (luciferase family)